MSGGRSGGEAELLLQKGRKQKGRKQKGRKQKERRQKERKQKGRKQKERRQKERKQKGRMGRGGSRAEEAGGGGEGGVFRKHRSVSKTQNYTIRKHILNFLWPRLPLVAQLQLLRVPPSPSPLLATHPPSPTEAVGMESDRMRWTRSVTRTRKVRQSASRRIRKTPCR